MDPNLGLAHAALSSAYGNVGDVKLSATAGQRAFALRDRMTAPARFNAESTYHLQVTGDLEARAPCSRSGSRPSRTTSSRATTSLVPREPGRARSGIGRIAGGCPAPSVALHLLDVDWTEPFTRTAWMKRRRLSTTRVGEASIRRYSAIYRSTVRSFETTMPHCRRSGRGRQVSPSASRDQWEGDGRGGLGASFVPPSARRRPRLR